MIMQSGKLGLASCAGENKSRSSYSQWQPVCEPCELAASDCASQQDGARLKKYEKLSRFQTIVLQISRKQSLRIQLDMKNQLCSMVTIEYSSNAFCHGPFRMTSYSVGFEFSTTYYVNIEYWTVDTLASLASCLAQATADVFTWRNQISPQLLNDLRYSVFTSTTALARYSCC